MDQTNTLWRYLVVPRTRLFNGTVSLPTFLPSTAFSPAINQGDQELFVDCVTLKGSPTPVLRWVGNGVHVSRNSSQPVYQEGQQISSNGMAGRRLVLQRFGVLEQGNYTCVGTNRAGIDFSTFTLILQGGIVLYGVPRKITMCLSLVVPGQPNSPVANVSNATAIQISWTAPTSDGHSAILYYELQYKDVGGVWTSKAKQIPSTATSAVFHHLRPFTSYEFRVRATNKLGPGNYSHPSIPVVTEQAGTCIEHAFLLSSTIYVNCKG